jgi:hypothetical protein
MSVNTYNLLLNEYKALQQKIINDTDSAEEFRRASDIKDFFDENTLIIQTLPEFKFAMEYIGFSNNALLDTIEHENAHGNMAESVGAEHHGYNLIFQRNEQGKLVVQPQAIIYIPDEWSKEDQENANYDITIAPEVYGNSLSDGDREDLKNNY